MVGETFDLFFIKILVARCRISLSKAKEYKVFLMKSEDILLVPVPKFRFCVFEGGYIYHAFCI